MTVKISKRIHVDGWGLMDIVDVKFKNKITWGSGTHGIIKCIGVRIFGYETTPSDRDKHYPVISIRPVNSKERVTSGARIEIPIESIPDLIEAIMLAAGEKFDFSCIAALAAKAGKNGDADNL